MKEVKRWVSPYAAGTESYKALELVRDRTEPDPDEGPFFVLAEDFDSIVKELEGKLEIASAGLIKAYEKHVLGRGNSYEAPISDALQALSPLPPEALALLDMPKEG